MKDHYNNITELSGVIVSASATASRLVLRIGDGLLEDATKPYAVVEFDPVPKTAAVAAAIRKLFPGTYTSFEEFRTDLGSLRIQVYDDIASEYTFSCTSYRISLEPANIEDLQRSLAGALATIEAYDRDIVQMRAKLGRLQQFVSEETVRCQRKEQFFAKGGVPAQTEVMKSHKDLLRRISKLIDGADNP